jgi:mannose-6-phosphate isomerase-like protein (cupin superfamily)
MSAIPGQSSKIIRVPAGGGHGLWVFGDLDVIKAAGEDTGGELTFVETVVPAESGPPLHIHERESESIYVLEGEVRVVADGEDFTLGPGGFVYMPKGSLHKFENTLKEPSKILLVFLPSGIEGYFEELGTVRVDDAPSPGRALDRELLARVAPKYGIEIFDDPEDPSVSS